MHRLYKENKRGFTLIEVILVVGIIIVLASVLVLSVNSILTTSKNKSKSISNEVTAVHTVRNVGEGQLSNYHF